MRKLLPVLFLALAAASTSANAWFFIFPIPVLNKQPGDSCVKESAKAGDTFTSANGAVATIKSTEGRSMRCRKPETPILARVEYGAAPGFTSKAGIEVHPSYQPQDLTERQKFNGTLLYAKNTPADSGVFVTSIRKEAVPDIEKHVTATKARALSVMGDEAKQTDTEQLTINGARAWRFETDGKLKSALSSRYTYVMTILEGDNEVVLVNAWVNHLKGELSKDDVKKFAMSVNGIRTEGAAAAEPAAVPVSAPAPEAEKPAEVTK